MLISPIIGVLWQLATKRVSNRRDVADRPDECCFVSCQLGAIAKEYCVLFIVGRHRSVDCDGRRIDLWFFTFRNQTDQ